MHANESQARTGLHLGKQAGPAFEVVSIKRGSLQTAGLPFPLRGFRLQGERWTASRVTLRELIHVAHAAEGFAMPGRTVGGPPWIDKDRFDIVAKAPARPSREELAAMIQGLLEDRFQVVLHTESRELPVFALIAARRDGKLGPRLRQSTVDCEKLVAQNTGRQATTRPQEPSGRPICGVTRIFGPPNRIVGGSTRMKEFASILAETLERPVIDQTGLAGAFDVDLEYSPDLPQALPDADGGDARLGDSASISTALQEQLGLKLDARRADVNVLVVDNAEQPTED